MLPQSKGRDGRPIAFLVSTTPCAAAIRENLGSASYSYYFVLEALAPLLESLGTLRPIDPAPSRLAFAARQAEAEGFRPIHLAIVAPQDAYYSPVVPTVLLPFWEFPDLPDRNFDRDTRHDWRRVCRGPALILSACAFTARAFRVSDVSCPVEVVPVPISPEAFALPDWDADRSWSLTCRHVIWGGPAKESPEQAIVSPKPRPGRLWSVVRSGFLKIEPWIDAERVGRLVRWKRRLAAIRGGSPGRSAYLGLRAGYKTLIRPWLSEESVARVTAVKNRALLRLGRSPRGVVDPLLPSSAITLSGLVYTSFLNVGDARKNYMDMISAFLLAFRDQGDVTLVLKLATSPDREHHELGVIRDRYRALGLDHACRIVVITDFLDDHQMAGLYRSTTYYVNTSHAEGACLPLMRALAGGRPAIAPDHTAMADYMDAGVGFVPRSHPEPTPWPHDPDRRLSTTRYRLVWSDILDAFLESARVARSDRDRYDRLAIEARRRLSALASREVVLRDLLQALERLEPALVRAS